MRRLHEAILSDGQGYRGFNVQSTVKTCGTIQVAHFGYIFLDNGFPEYKRTTNLTQTYQKNNRNVIPVLQYEFLDA